MKTSSKQAQAKSLDEAQPLENRKQDQSEQENHRSSTCTNLTINNCCAVVLRNYVKMFYICFEIFSVILPMYCYVFICRIFSEGRDVRFILVFMVICSDWSKAHGFVCG